MSTAHSSPSGRLTPSWLPSFSRRGSRAPSVEGQSPNPDGLLVPRHTSRSSESEESRSVKSTRSDVFQAWRFINKLSTKFPRKRSPSTAGYDALTPPILGLKDFENEDLHDWKAGFAKYNQLVTNQVSKDGSFQSKEFLSICKELTKQCGGGFAHGLPETVFDLALLWCPTGTLHRKDHPASEPSWSWTGWDGAGMNFPFDPYSCPDIRRLEGDYFKSEIDNYYRGPTDLPWTVRRDRGKTGTLRISVPYGNPPLGKEWPDKDTDALRFTAFTIPSGSFHMSQVVDDDKQKMPYSELMDGKGQHCGTIMDYEHLISAGGDRPRTLEYVLLSRNRRCAAKENTARPAANTAHPPGTPIWKDGRFLWDQALEDFDETKFKESEWCMLNVMLIEYQEEGWYERVAVGQMHETAWKAQNPKRREVVLR